MPPKKPHSGQFGSAHRDVESHGHDLTLSGVTRLVASLLLLEQHLEGLNGKHAAEVQEYERKIKTASDDFAFTMKQMSEELASTKQAADKVSDELEGTKDKLGKATTKGKELGDEVEELKGKLSQSQKEHDAAVKAGSVLSQQLEGLNGKHAAEVQEYERKIKTASDDFAFTMKQMSEELASTKQAADKVSDELEGTKDKLGKATTKGKELGDEVEELKGKLSQSQKEHDAAVKAGSVLSQQLECLKGEYAAKVQEYERKIKTASDDFAFTMKQMSEKIASTKKAADEVALFRRTTLPGYVKQCELFGQMINALFAELKKNSRIHTPS
jgi:chromosome segregation ATPase